MSQKVAGLGLGRLNLTPELFPGTTPTLGLQGCWTSREVNSGPVLLLSMSKSTPHFEPQFLHQQNGMNTIICPLPKTTVNSSTANNR